MTLTAFKQALKELPLVRNVVEQRYDRRFAQNTQEQLYRGIFGTFEEAEQSFPAPRLGYDHPEAAGMYEELMTKVEDYDYPVLYWMNQLIHDHELRSVLDYGGHIGIKRYAYEPFLPICLDWQVYDVPAVIARGRNVAAKRSDAGGLTFTSDFAGGIKGKGALLCLGSLQYVKPSLAELLAPLDCNRVPHHLLINTTPFTDEEPFFTLNSFGTSFAPYKIQNEAEFEQEMLDVGYRVLDRWKNPGRACHVPFQTERKDFRYLGMRLERA